MFYFAFVLNHVSTLEEERDLYIFRTLRVQKKAFLSKLEQNMVVCSLVYNNVMCTLCRKNDRLRLLFDVNP